MLDQHALVAEILPTLLSETTPELGARLNQRIQAVFSSKGLPAFDPQKEGYPKFSVYIERLHGDIAKVLRTPGKSDVDVYKKTHLSSANFSTQPSPVVLSSPNVVVRSNVWQAFLNPDQSRKRFFDKRSKDILHYIPQKDSFEQKAIAANPDSFVEITPILGEMQLKWMRDFLESAPLNEPEKQVIASQIGDKYSSALNATFIKSLGAHGTLWRQYRIPRVINYIEEWASANSISLSDICFSGSWKAPSLSKTQTNNICSTDQLNIAEALPPRQLACKLLDLMPEDDIAQLILPVMMNALLLKSRQ